MATDAPPSYDSVVSEINKKLGKSTDLKYVTDVLASVPQEHKQILIANPHPTNVSLTEEQKKKMARGMIDAAQSEFAADIIKLSASHACLAVKTIESIFSTLLVKLSGIDSDDKYPEPKEGAFRPRLEGMKSTFREIVSKSRKLAVHAASHGDRLDDVIIPFVRDGGYGTDAKLKKLENFIKEAEVFKTDSTDIDNKYDKLKDDMDVFVGQFSKWAEEQGYQIDQKVENLTNDINDLKEKISQERVAMIGLSIGAAAVTVGTAVLASIFVPFAPAIIVIGLTAAGAKTAAAIALAYDISNKQNQIDAKNKQTDALKKEKHDIVEARDKLDSLCQNDLGGFKGNVDILASFWKSATAEAQQVQDYLKHGKEDIDTPDYYNKKSIQPASALYKKMSHYLTDYAKGIDDSDLPKPGS